MTFLFLAEKLLEDIEKILFEIGNREEEKMEIKKLAEELINSSRPFHVISQLNEWCKNKGLNLMELVNKPPPLERWRRIVKLVSPPLPRPINLTQISREELTLLLQKNYIEKINGGVIEYYPFGTRKSIQQLTHIFVEDFIKNDMDFSKNDLITLFPFPLTDVLKSEAFKYAKKFVEEGWLKDMGGKYLTLYKSVNNVHKLERAWVESIIQKLKKYGHCVIGVEEIEGSLKPYKVQGYSEEQLIEAVANYFTQLGYEVETSIKKTKTSFLKEVFIYGD